MSSHWIARVSFALLAVFVAATACSGRQSTQRTQPGTPPPVAEVPIDLDGSLLNDPTFQATLMPTCVQPSTGQTCGGGCRWIAGACRRVQGGIGQPEAQGDAGAALSLPAANVDAGGLGGIGQPEALGDARAAATTAGTL